MNDNKFLLSAGAAFFWMRSTTIIANDLDRMDALEDQPKSEKSKSEKPKAEKIESEPKSDDSENK